MVVYEKFSDYLWIPLILIFLFPIIMYSGSHYTVDDSQVIQGPLVVGREALDSLISLNEGKPIIVNFWAVWCTPCVGELPHIDEVYRSMEGDIAAIAVDLGDPELETLLNFREGFKLSMPVVWLNESDAALLKDEWHLSNVLPITVVFDSEGTEITRAAGVRDESFFRNAVSGSLMPDTSDEHHDEELELHINVVGFSADTLTDILMDRAVELAGEEGVDFYDPSIPSDSLEIEAMHLPNSAYPYAQPCIGAACGRPAGTPDELQQVVENLSN
ncbi:MAG: redoxin domain-containing protein [Candidatus Aegiribacteria sp.]|nr:redoxin domain-containing protein [Candidatus Aegiribacteria sp.]